MALLSILMVLVYLGAITYLIGLPVMLITLRERVASLMRGIASLSREMEGIEKARTIDAVSSATVRTIVDAHSVELIAQLKRIHDARSDVQAALAATQIEVVSSSVSITKIEEWLARMELRLDRRDSAQDGKDTPV